jgi:signal transduction histidine kinase
MVVPPASPCLDAGWTPLRMGLALAWSATALALLAVALGGWSLIVFGERRLRFVSTVTHEVRTPLTTLRLYLDMLLGGLVPEPEQKREYLQTLADETDRLHRLINNVLDFSRLENARPRVELTTVPVAELLDRVRDTWRQRCREAGKELTVENESPEGSVLTTDVSLVEQILGNLIDNACKYSRGAADPRVRVRACHEQPGRLLFFVEDFGSGVARGERRAIFHAFRRGRTTEMSAEGVGLGLALARRWARLLGGRLTLRSAAGACFCMELPAAV